MNRIISSVFTALALVFLPREEAVAQTANELVGTWTIVSITREQNGKKTDYFGSNPQVQAIFETNGHFSTFFIRSDVPKFASNDREAGTPEENKSAVQGSVAYFGTYSISEADHTLNFHIEGQYIPKLEGNRSEPTL